MLQNEPSLAMPASHSELADEDLSLCLRLFLFLCNFAFQISKYLF